VRTFVRAPLGGTTVYGPLTAPIVLLIGLYAVAFAVLVGAALNAATLQLWLTPEGSLRPRRGRSKTTAA
jgi:membrane protein